MKTTKILLTLTLVLLSALSLFPQDRESPDSSRMLLKTIADDINNYRSRTITLRLKLKNVDRIFEKITFYDAKNNDIEFDISDRFVKKRIAADMLNLHEGMDYDVTFLIKNIGNLGQIIAELRGFKPAILDIIPERNDK